MAMLEAPMEVLIRSSIGLAIVLAVLLLLRPLVVRGLGARAMRSLWLAVPLSVFAALLPAAVEPGASMGGLVVMQAASRVAMAAGGVQTATPWALLAIAIWFASAALLGSVLVQRQRRFDARLLPAKDGRGMRLPAGDSPAVTGVWRPRIVLPLDFEVRFTADEQALILAHEGVHLARRDPAWNLLASILWCAQWFNPLAWLAIRAFREDQERACDAEVMRTHPGSARTYAAAMLKQADGDRAPLASAWVGRHPLVDRVAALRMHRHRLGRWRVVASVVLCAGLVAIANAATGRSGDAGVDAPSTDQRFVRLDVEVLAGDDIVAQPIIVVREGSAGSVSLDGPEGFDIEATARGAGADRIGLALRHAASPGGALAVVGEQVAVAGGAWVAFDLPSKAGTPITRVRIAARWITAAQMDALFEQQR